SVNRKRRTPKPFSHRLAFERLETRCLLSSGLEPTLFIANPLRASLPEETPTASIALVQVQEEAPDEAPTHRRIEVIYANEAGALPWESFEATELDLSGHVTEDDGHATAPNGDAGWIGALDPVKDEDGSLGEMTSHPELDHGGEEDPP